MHKLMPLAVLAVLCGSLCVASKPVQAEEQLARLGTSERAEQDGTLLDASNRVAETLSCMLKKRGGEQGLILVAALTKLDDMADTSPFGRLVSQQISSRLGTLGHNVVEARLRKNYSISVKGGEQLLTQIPTDMRTETYPTWAALVGNYSLTRDYVFVSTRVVRMEDGVILAADEYRLPLRGSIRQLFTGSGIGESVWAKYALRDPAFINTSATADALAPADPAVLPLLGSFPPIAGGSKVKSAKTGSPQRKVATKASRPKAKAAPPKAAPKQDGPELGEWK